MPLEKKEVRRGAPRCANCNSLQISCFGYGQKPGWMDGGVKERTVAKATLDTVKQTTDKTRRLKRLENLSNSAGSYSTVSHPSLGTFNTESLRIEFEQDAQHFTHDKYDKIIPAHDPVEISIFFRETDSATLPGTTLSPQPITAITDDTYETGRSLQDWLTPDDSTEIDGIESRTVYLPNSSDTIGEKSTCLTMDYIDSGFFCQFPLYTPLSTKGGRG